MDEIQERVIRENPHLANRKLALVLGLTALQVSNFRLRKKIKSWRYDGTGIPFMYFSNSCGQYFVAYKHQVIYNGLIDKAFVVVDQLISYIENGRFKEPRIKHPYLYDLKFGENNGNTSN